MPVAGAFKPRMHSRRGATFAMIRLPCYPTHMGNTFTSLHCHFVFSTKHREAWISHGIEERVWSFLGGIARENGMKPIRIGGMPDHIHMAVGLPPTLAVAPRHGRSVD